MRSAERNGFVPLQRHRLAPISGTNRETRPLHARAARERGRDSRDGEVMPRPLNRRRLVSRKLIEAASRRSRRQPSCAASSFRTSDGCNSDGRRGFSGSRSGNARSRASAGWPRHRVSMPQGGHDSRGSPPVPPTSAIRQKPCGHARHVGWCPACQRAELGRWDAQLAQSSRMGRAR